MVIPNWLRRPPSSPPGFDPRSYFEVPMFDLGEVEQRFCGILSPEPERGAAKIGITEQFLENAEIYHTRYLNTDHYQSALAKALAAANFKASPGLEILDIGAGSGANSVVPCVRLFDSPRIIATDLSPNLLAILRDYLRHAEPNAGVACICTDSMRDFLKPNHFDLVIGAAILHHLINPVTALRSARRALRTGGVALFFEPFEAGHLVLCAAFRQILTLQERLGALEPLPAKVLSDMILDWSTRVGTDKSAPHFAHMDDKWMFTPDYLTRACRELGFDPPILMPQHEPADPGGSFAGLTETILRLHSRLSRDSLPDWAWDILEELDRTFSPDMKQVLRLEAIIVLRAS